MADVEGKCRSLPSTLNQRSEDTISSRSPLYCSKPGRLDATSTNDSQNESSSKRHRPLETHHGARGGQSSGQRPVGASDLPVSAAQKPEPKPRSLLSHETIVNIRYSRDHGHSAPDHSNEDDVVIVQAQNMKLFAVLDGHDGNNAVKFVSGYLRTTGFIELVNSAQLNEDVFEELFRKMDNGFFNDIRFYTNKKKKLQQKFKNLSSYEAYLRYPSEVAELQELEASVSGGTTVVVAVIFQEKLYVANVGDSRALLVRQLSDGLLYMEQLSDDHGVENELELARLEIIGLDREELRRSGRLGSQENTRSIGDYSIKEGYKDVDAISSASQPPGISTPFVCSTVIDSSFKYLILMSDGVYKSIEALSHPCTKEEGEKTFLAMLKVSIDACPNDFQQVAKHILNKIAVAHERVFYEEDPRSPKAVRCRKRDDMSLVVYQFRPMQTTSKQETAV